MRTNAMLALGVANNAASVVPAMSVTCQSNPVVAMLEASGAGSAWGRAVAFDLLHFGVTNLRNADLGPPSPGRSISGGGDAAELGYVRQR